MQLQVPIFEILHKYDGGKVHDDIKLGRRRYKFMRLPRFLAMHMKRFTKNNFYVRPARLPTCLHSACHLRSLLAADLLQTVLCCALAVSLCLEQLISKCVLRAQVEKNPTIVNFPVKNLLLKDVMPVPTGMCFSRLCPQLRHWTTGVQHVANQAAMICFSCLQQSTVQRYHSKHLDACCRQGRQAGAVQVRSAGQHCARWQGGGGVLPRTHPPQGANVILQRSFN